MYSARGKAILNPTGFLNISDNITTLPQRTGTYDYHNPDFSAAENHIRQYGYRTVPVQGVQGGWVYEARTRQWWVPIMKEKKVNPDPINPTRDELIEAYDQLGVKAFKNSAALVDALLDTIKAARDRKALQNISDNALALQLRGLLDIPSVSFQRDLLQEAADRLEDK